MKKPKAKTPRDPKRQTKRLILRPFRASDYGAWCAVHRLAGSSANEWEVDPKKAAQITREEFRKQVADAAEKRKRGVFFTFGVFLKSGELVGGVSLMDVVRGVQHCTYLGYGIHNPYWGNGYAVEACEAALDIAFRDLRLHRVEAGIEPGNKQSHRVAKKLGMRDEGTSPRKLFLRSKWRDMVNYALTCEERGIRWKTVLKDG